MKLRNVTFSVSATREGYKTRIAGYAFACTPQGYAIDFRCIRERTHSSSDARVVESMQQEWANFSIIAQESGYV